MKIDPYLLFGKIVLQVDQGPDHITRYTKYDRGEVGNSLECTGTGENVLNRSSIAQALRSTIDKWDLRKLKSFCKAKDFINRTNWQATD